MNLLRLLLVSIFFFANTIKTYLVGVLCIFSKKLTNGLILFNYLIHYFENIKNCKYPIVEPKSNENTNAMRYFKLNYQLFLIAMVLKEQINAIPKNYKLFKYGISMLIITN